MHKNGFLCIVAMMVFVACKKDEKPIPVNTGSPQWLLDSIRWNTDDLKAIFQYKSDSSQQRIIYSSGVATDTISFTYQDNKVQRISSSRASRHSDYQYESSGKVKSIVMSSIYSTSVTYLEYAYSNGRLHTLDYFSGNEAGKSLIWHSVYEYNADGLPSKITSVGKNNQTVVWTIEAYSAACDFNPWAFINHTSVDELYEVYNYPLMASMNRLPARIVKTSQQVEKIYTITFDIAAKKLRQSTTAVEFLQYPEYNGGYTANYFYR